MAEKATGDFSVKMTPVAWSETVTDAALGRFLLDKRYYGDLEAASIGQMLTAGAVQTGSAGYVAIEKVTGTLHGRSGSFAMQHNGVMNGGVAQLAIAVVPGSGSDELSGIAGTMTLEIAGGKHSYVLEYTLANA